MGVGQEMTKGISEEQTLKEKKASTLWVEVAGACLGHVLSGPQECFPVSWQS